MIAAAFLAAALSIAPAQRVFDDARIPNDWSKIVVAAEERARLELKPGCKVVAGSREGDYRVTCE